MAFVLHIERANNLPCMDRGSLSDPYLRIVVLNNRDEKVVDVKTKPIMNTLNPEFAFDAHFLDALKPENGILRFLTIEVWDYDKGESDDFMGQVQFRLPAIDGIPQTDVQKLRDKIGHTTSGTLKMFLSYDTQKTMEAPFTVEDLSSAFVEMDPDGNGLISQPDLEELLERLGMPKKQAVKNVANFFALADPDEKGEINYNQFVEEYIRMQCFKTLRSFKLHFQEMDTDFNRLLDRHEFLNGLSRFLGPKTAAIVSEPLFRDIDSNDSGSLSFQELEVWYRKKSRTLGLASPSSAPKFSASEIEAKRRREEEEQKRTQLEREEEKRDQELKRPESKWLHTNESGIRFPTQKLVSLENASRLPRCGARGLIHIGVGDCGIALTNAFYHQLAEERGLNKHGVFDNHSPDTKGVNMDGVDTFWNETSLGEYHPRSVLVDIDRDFKLEQGKSHLFVGDVVSRGVLPGGTNFSFGQGHGVKGRGVSHRALELVRREAERCDSFQGFTMSHSLIGGTGSGCTSILGCLLQENYPKSPILTFSVAGNYSDNPVKANEEVVNPIMSLHYLRQFASASILIDNSTIFNAHKKMRLKTSYRRLNMDIASVMNDVTCAFRYETKYSIHRTLPQFVSHFSAFPRMPFLSAHRTPFSGQRLHGHELSASVFMPKQRTWPIKLSSQRSKRLKYVAASALFRGPVDQVAAEIQVAREMKDGRSVMPNCIKTDFCQVANGGPNGGGKASAVLIANHTGIGKGLQVLAERFSEFQERHSIELAQMAIGGMHEWEFSEAVEDILQLCSKYSKLGRFYDMSINSQSLAHQMEKARMGDDDPLSSSSDDSDSEHSDG